MYEISVTHFGFGRSAWKSRLKKFSALFLIFDDLSCQRLIPILLIHSFYIAVITASGHFKKQAHGCNRIVLFIPENHPILQFRFHLLPVSWRKSRNNSFSIFNRLISNLYSFSLAGWLSRDLPRRFGTSPAASLACDLLWFNLLFRKP